MRAIRTAPNMYAMAAVSLPRAPPRSDPMPDAQELIKALSGLPNIDTTTMTTNARKSTTMEEDISQPPTPDGSALPANFGLIDQGLYRASYPQPVHFEALQALNLRTIVTLVAGGMAGDVPAPYAAFAAHNGIRHHVVPVLPNKDPAVYTADRVVLQIVRLMLDPANHPVLIHCNKGKHRTGCVAACYRKVTGWPLDRCLAEYEAYSRPKARPLDKVFIARFDETALQGQLGRDEFVARPPGTWSYDSLLSNYTRLSSADSARPPGSFLDDSDDSVYDLEDESLPRVDQMEKGERKKIIKSLTL